MKINTLKEMKKIKEYELEAKGQGCQIIDMDLYDHTSRSHFWSEIFAYLMVMLLYFALGMLTVFVAVSQNFHIIGG